MRTTLRSAAAALAGATLLFASAPLHAADDNLLPVGSQAPRWRRSTPREALHAGGGLKEKSVLLVFWSLFCGTCRDELPILEQEQPKYADKLQIVTINLDEAPRAKTVKGFASSRVSRSGCCSTRSRGGSS